MYNQLNPRDFYEANALQGTHCVLRWLPGVVSPLDSSFDNVDNHLNFSNSNEDSALSVSPHALLNQPPAKYFNIPTAYASAEYESIDPLIDNGDWSILGLGQELDGDFSPIAEYPIEEEPSTSSYHHDDERTENNTATDSNSSAEEEETVEHNNENHHHHHHQPVVDDNELEEEDDAGVVPVDVFGAYDPYGVPDMLALKRIASHRITQYREAKSQGILKKRRFLVVGRLYSILALCTMRDVPDIAPDNSLTHFEKKALLAACQSCRNQWSLFEGREAKKQKAGKARGRPSRKSKVGTNANEKLMSTSNRIHKTKHS